MNSSVSGLGILFYSLVEVSFKHNYRGRPDDAPHPENPRIEHENLHALEDRAHEGAPVDLQMLNHTKSLQERTQDPDDGSRQQSGVLLIRHRHTDREVQHASGHEGPDEYGDEHGRVRSLTQEARLRAVVHAWGLLFGSACQAAQVA